MEADEIFGSDGAKSDCGNIQRFWPDCRICGVRPKIPVYVDSNDGRQSWVADLATGKWSCDLYARTAETACAGAPKERPILDASLRAQQSHRHRSHPTSWRCGWTTPWRAVISR